MALISSNGLAHVRLTVTDIERSKKFYDQVFGWPAAVDMSEQAEDPEVRTSQEQFYGGVIYQTPQGTLFGLRPVGEQSFDADTTGLDHVKLLRGVPRDPAAGCGGALRSQDRAR